jgi:hypothetical protein
VGGAQDETAVELAPPAADGVTTSGSAPGGRAVVRGAQGDWRADVVVSGLLPLAPGRVYVVWLVLADGSRLNAGEFMVDDLGQAMLTVTLDAAGLSDIAGFAVSDEPPGARAPSRPDALSGVLSR